MSVVDGGAPGPLTVLVVCTGNVCRSPAVALLLRAGLGARADVSVASAGLHARVGEPVAVPMARLLDARGVDSGGFAARQLTPDVLREADLVLTMTTGQRAAVVPRAPGLVRRTFTLLEFTDLARLTEVPRDVATPADRLRVVVQDAPRARGRRSAGAPRGDDIEDPYGHPSEVYLRVADRIGRAVEDLLAVLAPAVVPVAVVPSGQGRR